MSAEVIPFNAASLEIIEKRANVEGSAIVQSANALAITDGPSFVLAGELRKEANVKDGILEKEFKPLKQAIDAAKKKILAFEKKAREPFQRAVEIIDGKLTAYNAEQERIRREKEVELRKIAAKLDEDRRLREAEQAVAAGASQDEAVTLLEQSPIVAAPIVASEVPKVEGLTFTVTYSAEVVDLNLLVQFAAMHPEMTASLVEPNQTGLNGLARSQKTALSIPGVRLVEKSGVSGTRS